MNRIDLIGRLTKPVTMYAGEKESCTGTLAVTKTKEQTDFIYFSAWDKTAQLLEKCEKGELIHVGGRLTTYKDKDEHIKLGVVITEVEYLAKPKKKE